MELKFAEERLQHKAMVGTMACGTRGLGYYLGPRIDRGKERALLQKEVREGIEETRLAKMVGLYQLGAWTRWKNYIRRRITWLDLWKAYLSQLRFQIQAVYDLLPSPSNLHTWGKNDTPACQLCGGEGTLQHLLSGCARSLSEGRYRWRHDQVHKAIAEVVSDAIKSNRFSPGRRKVIFVWAGSSKQPQTKNKVTLLLLHSHIPKYGHVQNGHIMFIKIEHIKNIGISEFGNA